MAKQTEYHLHVAVADFLRAALPDDVLWTHLPMGENRDARTGAKLKKMGTQPGWPDFMFIRGRGRRTGYPYPVIFIELKRPGGRLTAPQQRFEERVDAIGHCHYTVAVADPVAEVAAILTQHNIKLKARAA